MPFPLPDTLPFPLPDAPVIVMNEVLLTAVHAHVGADAVTVTVSVVAFASIDAVSGAMVNVHGGGGGGVPACDTVKVWPAIVTVPVRGSVPLFAAYDSATAPLPVPLAADVIVTQAAFEDAAHAHVEADAVTATDPLPPDAATL